MGTLSSREPGGHSSPEPALTKALRPRLDAVNTLVAKWVKERLDSLKLSKKQRQEIAEKMQRGRKDGMISMGTMQSSNLLTGWEDLRGCATRDAANLAFGN